MAGEHTRHGGRLIHMAVDACRYWGASRFFAGPDGRLLYTGDGAGLLKVWRCTTDECVGGLLGCRWWGWRGHFNRSAVLR